MPLTDRENFLRNARFQQPEWIPCGVYLSGASWNAQGRDMEEVVLRHPRLFPGYVKGSRKFENPIAREEGYPTGTDAWGCVWEYSMDGLEGIVVHSPVADWPDLENFHSPDPERQWARGDFNWEETLRNIRERKSRGELTSGHVEHGFLFLRLAYLRGFENFMMDMAAEDPHLNQLINRVEEFNLAIVKKYCAEGVDLFVFGDDLGTQTASMVSPATFGKWITPAYRNLMQPCHEAGALVFLHSDGHVMELMDEFVKAGVDIINPQDRVNGIDNLAREVKGRMCIQLDLDRQYTLPFGTRREIEDLVEEAVRKLGSPEGGLEFIAGVYPPMPAENVDALCAALEKYQRYWWE